MDNTYYNLNKQFSKMKHILGIEVSDVNFYEGFKQWIENYIEITKPDFICFLNLKKSDPIVYTENFNLKFGKGKAVTLSEIMSLIDSRQAVKIFEVDSKLIKIIKDNIIVPHKSISELRFTASLIDGKPRSLLRSSSFLAVNDSSKPYLAVVSITDITEIYGVSEHASFKVRWEKGVDLDLDKRLTYIENEMNKVLSPEIKLTKREREILILISKGNTSETIAKELIISTTTVNTHRQNLIKKFNVKNTAALINKV